MAQILLLVAIFAVGVVILYYGAEGMLHGAVSIATRMGVSQLVIGLTLVAFGTSAPELSLDISAAIKGSTQLAFGDLVGSNISNIGLILGIAAIICPLRINMRLLRAELPIMIAVSLLVLGLAFDGEISRQDGIFMLAAFVLFLGYSYRSARQESARVKEQFKEEAEETALPGEPIGRSTLLVVVGLAGLVIGAQLMVYSAVATAKLLGVSELLIGLTIVAIGTSMPEFVTSVVAAFRKHGDVALGNIMGSNIYNILGIGGATALLSPTEVPAEIANFDNLVMLAACAAMFAFAWSGYRINRTEGAALLAGYIAYIYVLLPK
jgi:cation:H+ antiporter